MDQLAANDESRPKRWTVPDLIDFDYFVDEDERSMGTSPSQRERLTERDRRLYLDDIAQSVGDLEPHRTRHRRQSLRLWLAARRAEQDPARASLLPGALFARGHRLATMVSGLVGGLFGAGVASALLAYDGIQPVNVSWYLFVLVLLQVLLASGALLALLLRRLEAVRSVIHDVSLIGYLLRPLIAKIVSKVQQRGMSRLAADVREDMATKRGQLQAHATLYGPTAHMSVLVPAQVFGIGFNLGAIATTLALIWFTDLAFGWGSALEVSAQTVHRMSAAIALPWSWLAGEGSGYPTLEQIIGSRINLKDLLMFLQAEDLRSWRWFLVLSVLTYGLLPRLLLLLVSVIVQHRTLAALPFTHQRAQSLYVRMLPPALSPTGPTSGGGPEMPIPGVVQEAPAEASPPLRPLGSALGTDLDGESWPADPEVAVDACLLILHIDVADMLTPSEHPKLQQLLLQITGWKVAGSMTVDGSSTMARRSIDLIQNARWQEPPARIAVIEDGSQPPITEGLRFLRELRSAAGERAQIVLALIGDPDGDDCLPPIRARDFEDWQRKIAQLADPYLRLDMLAGSAEEMS